MLTAEKMYDAIIGGNDALVLQEIEKGFFINRFLDRDRTLAQIAAENGRIELLSALQKHGANPIDSTSAVRLVGRGVLMRQELENFEVLLRAGLDPDLADKKSDGDETSLVHMAAGMLRPDFLALLDAYGADFSRGENDLIFATPYHSAIFRLITMPYDPEEDREWFQTLLALLRGGANPFFYADHPPHTRLLCWMQVFDTHLHGIDDLLNMRLLDLNEAFCRVVGTVKHGEAFERLADVWHAMVVGRKKNLWAAKIAAAILDSNLELLKTSLEDSRLSVNHCFNGKRFLALAFELKDSACFEYLLSRNANVHLTGRLMKESVLDQSLTIGKNGNFWVLDKIVIMASRLPQKKNVEGENLLHDFFSSRFCEKNEGLSLLLSLIQKNPSSLFEKNRREESPLDIAVRLRRQRCLRLLVLENIISASHLDKAPTNYVVRLLKAAEELVENFRSLQEHDARKRGQKPNLFKISTKLERIKQPTNWTVTERQRLQTTCAETALTTAFHTTLRRRSIPEIPIEPTTKRGQRLNLVS